MDDRERTPKALRSGRNASVVSSGRVGTMVLAGLVLGLLIIGIGLLVVEVDQGFESIDVKAVLVLGVIVGLPALLGFVVWRAARPLRHLALGLWAGCCLALVGLTAIGIWTGFDPSAMTQREIDDALADITSSDREAFYLGDEADDKKLAVIDDQFGVLHFHYGQCLDNSEGGCNRPLNVSSQPTKTCCQPGDAPAGLPCARLQPVLGVPAADVAGDLTVFTGSSMVTVTYWKVVSDGLMTDRPRTASVAPRLRPVGEPTAVESLPPPDPYTQAFVDRHCGLKPGDTSRLP